MGAAVLERLPTTVQFFDQANEILGYDLKQLCLEGPKETLQNTLHAQPALLTVGVMHFEAAKSEGLEPQVVAGHSLGEYSALVAAGALDFATAMKLVKRRAELMAAAPEGAMAALIGLADEKLADVLAEASVTGTVVAANFNSPGQVVVSGEPAAVEAAMAAAKGNGAKLAVRLQVSGAFHSPLMAEAAAEMAALLDGAEFNHAAVPVVQNTSAKPATAPSELRDALRPQMTGAVRWTESVQAMLGMGVTSFTELGPGKVLTGLVKRIDKTVETVNL